MPTLRSALLFALLLAIAGCGPTPVSLRGTVTANGKPVEEGNITFHPSDGKNTTSGADIRNGAFQAMVNPGKYTVVITGGGKTPAYPKSQEDLKKMSDKELEIADTIPADAKGNNQEMEITAGRELNISLEYSPQGK
jgi:hypothetical protein